MSNLISDVTFGDVTLRLLGGFGYTCAIFAITLVCALPLGMVFCMLSRCRLKPVRAVMRVFVWIIRCTPLMLQIFVVFFVPGLVFNVSGMDRFLAVCIAFVINYAVYFSEIYRGGIEAIPAGQYEACRVLGLTRSQTFFRVVLPQVVKRIMPPMSNEVMTLVKDTSLANVISIGELILTAKEIVNMNGIIYPLFYTAVFYLAMCGILTLLFRFAEKKLDYYKG